VRGLWMLAEGQGEMPAGPGSRPALLSVGANYRSRFTAGCVLVGTRDGAMPKGVPG
jgi:hypothetical protein